MTLCASAQNSPWGSLEERIKASADRANQSLPRMVGEELRQEKIYTAAGGVMVVSYTVLRAVTREEINHINTQGRRDSITSACTIGVTRAAIDLGATIRYVLRNPLGSTISSIDITKRDCS